MKGDAWYLVRGTFSLYIKATVSAARAAFSNARLIVPQAVIALIFPSIASIIGVFGNVAAGFLVGLLLAIVLSYYLLTVRSAVQSEDLSIRESLSRPFELFGPALSVLFVLYILTLFGELALTRPEQLWIKLSLSLVVAVLFNPLPEIIYLAPSHTFDMFSESLEFMKENFVEWFLPFVIIGAPILIVAPSAALNVGLAVTILNPIYLLQGMISVIGSIPIPVMPFILIAVYFVFVFRGFLFIALHSSTRRKRIYSARQELN